MIAQNIEDNMISVEGGIFWMGNDKGEYRCEKPAHQVELKSFCIGKFPVTQDLWKEIMKDDIHQILTEDSLPITGISWEEIHSFLKKVRLQTGKIYRLPTEAEWEYAAKGGRSNKGYQYSGSNELDKVGWYSENSEKEIHPVGQKEPNELGIYDMSGNIWEYCHDWYSDTYYSENKRRNIVKNPICSHPHKLGPAELECRVARGGSAHMGDSLARVTYRIKWEIGNKSDFLGFRLCSNT